ncbi:MAG: ABC transporter permease subunit [Rhodospirillaceae bacterium]|nr:ABC transporter permease subunit [Rhodospirillaceae bacterium]
MKTPRSVIVADKTADWVIRVGGISVIVAVVGIMVFLAQVVVPLFTGGRVEGQTAFDKPSIPASAVPVAAGEAAGDERALTELIDEYRTIAVSITSGGGVEALHIKTGTPLTAPAFDLGGQAPTAFSRTIVGGDVAFGFADGTLRLGKVRIAGEIIEASAQPAGLQPLAGTGDSTDGTAIYTAIPGGQVRRLTVEVALGPVQQIAPVGTAIVAMDYRVGGTVERPSSAFATVDATGIARLSRAETRRNMMTGQERVTVSSTELSKLPDGVVVANVLMNDKADQVFIAAKDGTVYRYDTRNFSAPELAETIDLAPGPADLTALRFLLGEQSIVAARSDGTVDVYFRLPRETGAGTDGFTLVRAKQLDPHAAAVVAVDASQRGKMFITADAQGEVWVRHSTSEQVLLRLKPSTSPLTYDAIALAPRENAVVAFARSGRVEAWDIAVPHPETTLQTIFGKVWYEGYSEPGYTWQSSSGTDAFEPKLSLIPLIFGTMKATLYSMLFAVPIALGAAIFTSEFVHPRVRAVVKPTMEMMASLPSVVLGFIAALVLAPLVETWIAAVVMAFFVLPVGLFAGAYLWQLLPNRTQLRFGGAPKFALMIVTLVLFALATYATAPSLERAFFAGNFKAWANGTAGSGVPFTALLLLPLAFLAVWIGTDRLAGHRVATLMRAENRTYASLFDGARWIATLAVAGALALLVALVLSGAGFDIRGGVVDTYVQRNTMVVGFAMGFAVIPIIYTIAEDALNAVPEHLRAASLGCGATPWQTAINVILPTAMSGVFAAIMIGMGRAVGETMIVVMAAGNTPILDWNIFEGLRALSANIAVELPEAVRNGTLYRMLFLAALTLFVMTFAVNTLAEVVRQRFRKRTASL